MRRFLLPVMTIWWREIIRFRRQRSRWVSAIAQPLVFWILLGGGLNASFRPAGVPEGTDYIEYFYPGIVTLVLLFTAIFATISVVQDRREGFLQGVLVAPVSRWCVVLGQALGGTTLALLQGALFLCFVPVIGVPLSVVSVLSMIGVMMLLAFGLTNLGLMIAWRMESTQGFHAIMNLILIPIWLLSGAFFPVSGVPVLLEWAMKFNPLTYGVAALRRCLYLGNPTIAGEIPQLTLSLLVVSLFCAVTYFSAACMAYRRPNVA
ncbi:MAG: ABC transporter permease [Candidatus Poribacteria bacterium]|nr:ABC transporter permease [Candidatus Poribacteria bacterium]